MNEGATQRTYFKGAACKCGHQRGLHWHGSGTCGFFESYALAFVNGKKKKDWHL